MTDNPTDLLTREYGGLPVWQWLGVGVAGWYLSKRFFGGTKTSGEQSDTAADYGNSDYTLPGSVYSYDQSLPPQGETGPTTNEEWQRRAFTAATAAGGFTTLIADQAIRKYLASQQLNTGEANVLSWVLAHNGLPPYPPALPEGGLFAYQGVNTVHPIPGAGGISTGAIRNRPRTEGRST